MINPFFKNVGPFIVSDILKQLNLNTNQKSTLEQTPIWEVILNLFWTSFVTDIGRQGRPQIDPKIGPADDQASTFVRSASTPDRAKVPPLEKYTHSYSLPAPQIKQQ